MKRIRIGGGAGYSGDRIEPAAELAAKGDIQYLIFECLAERTIALAQQAKRNDPSKGYDPLLAERMRAVLGNCAKQRIKIITNMGAANPLAGAQKVAEIARSLNLRGLRIAAIMGDDVLHVIRRGDYPSPEREPSIEALGERIISANAYLGAKRICFCSLRRCVLTLRLWVARLSVWRARLPADFVLAIGDQKFYRANVR